MSTPATLTTAEELLRMSNDGVRYELIEGRLKKTESDWSRTRSDSCPLSLVRRLANHVEDNNLGVALAAETGFRLAQDPDTVRAPGEEVEEKVNDWLDHGCSMVWVVSPKQKTITVSCSQTDITILSENETLDGRDFNAACKRSSRFHHYVYYQRP